MASYSNDSISQESEGPRDRHDEMLERRMEINRIIQKAVGIAEEEGTKASLAEVGFMVGTAILEIGGEKSVDARAMRKGYNSDVSTVHEVFMAPLAYLMYTGRVQYVDGPSLESMIKLSGQKFFGPRSYWKKVVIQGMSEHADVMKGLFGVFKQDSPFDPALLYENSKWGAGDSFVSGVVDEAFTSVEKLDAFMKAFPTLVKASPRAFTRSGTLAFLIARFADAYAPNYIGEPRAAGMEALHLPSAMKIVSRKRIDRWLKSTAQMAVAYRNRYLESVKVGADPDTIPRLSAYSPYVQGQTAGFVLQGRPVLFDVARLNSAVVFLYLIESALTEMEWNATVFKTGMDLATYIEDMVEAVRSYEMELNAARNLESMLLILEARNENL